jgi:hypothetical protein
MYFILIFGLFFLGWGMFFTLLACEKHNWEDFWIPYKTAAIISWIGLAYIIAVQLTVTRNPGCVEWHKEGSNPRTVTDGEHLVGKVWKESSHLEWDIDYVPYECDCVTYHWLFIGGDWNEFTQDSVIKGGFSGPTVKPDKLNLEQ